MLPEVGPLGVLLVEDNAVDRKIAQKMLERLSYSCDIAYKGLEVPEALGAPALRL